MQTTTATRLSIGTKVAIGVTIGAGALGLSLAGYPMYNSWYNAQNRAASSSGGCVISGCNSEFCSESPRRSICIVKPEAACYQTARCERQSSGSCDWTPSVELQSCLAGYGYNPQPYTPPQPPCIVTGCRREICSDHTGYSICMNLDTDQCYQSATCARQSNGQCGWTQTPQLQRCLAQYAPPAYTPPPAQPTPPAIPPLVGQIVDDTPCGGLEQRGCPLGTAGTFNHCSPPYVFNDYGNGNTFCRPCQNGQVYDNGGCSVPQSGSGRPGRGSGRGGAGGRYVGG